MLQTKMLGLVVNIAMGTPKTVAEMIQPKYKLIESLDTFMS